MKKTIVKILANGILFVHALVVFIILFGWRFDKFSWVYISILSITFFTQLFLGYCFLTRWEFNLRKKLDPTLDYDSSFLSWYMYKYSNIHIPTKGIKYVSLAFLFISIVIFLYSNVIKNIQT
jgi:hypothetical protein